MRKGSDLGQYGETGEELSKFNKPFNNQTIKKDFAFCIGFQSVFLYGARDYVKPVSSHEAVFVKY
jgi:hypothetical protein